MSGVLKKQIEPRRYQETIFARATMNNTLVVLPTGLGKTMIAIMLTIHRLKQYPDSKILILAPTKPLAQQHERTFREFLDLEEDELVLFTGSVRPEKRQKLWETAKVIFSTPQGLENDVMGSRISLKDVSLVVFDEAHRTVGDYAYVFLAKKYSQQGQRQRVLALTASPGTSEEQITEVCDNLHIEEIEVRSQEDNDVNPYVQELDISWVKVNLPEEFLVVRRILQKIFDERISQLKNIDGVNFRDKYVNKTTLLKLTGQLQGMLAREKDFEMMKAVSKSAEALKIHHAIELLDTQGIHALRKYFSNIQQQADKGQSKAVKNVVADPMWKTAKIKVDSLLNRKLEHPKLTELRKILMNETRSNRESKIIVFTQYRDQGTRINEALDEVGVSSKVFMGQAKKSGTGMSQKEQKQILDEFRNGDFTALIATSVAEEGLDIPKVDLVVFFEPVPSAIRTVQRRGRTGRGEKGRVLVLMTEGTVDVGYKWSAHHKEKRMYRAINKVKKNFKLEPAEKQQKNLLQEYFAEKREKQKSEIGDLKIIADYREKGSPVLKELSDSGVHLELQQLGVGDFQVSDRVVVEYKQVPDFVNSILDGRLLEQLKALRQYTRPIILIEGIQDIYSVRRIHPNAIRGMLSTIAVSYNIPILWSKNAKETVGLLISLAKREQVGGQDFQYHSTKPLTDKELQEYIVAAFPGVGNQLAKPLLERFGSIVGILTASESELREVPLIGPVKAKRIKEIAERAYQ